LKIHRNTDIPADVIFSDNHWLNTKKSFKLKIPFFEALLMH